MTDSLEPTLLDQDGQANPGLAPAQQASQTSADNPWPLHQLSHKLHHYLGKCPATWVEGQIIELNKRARVTYLTLRDVTEEVSVPVTLFAQETARLEQEIERVQRVVLQVKPDFWVKTGRLSMLGRSIRPVGLGSMLERIEKLRQQLAAEGLFSQGHKQALPLLPRRIGLITGRDSDAQKDVLKNASQRWPSVDFLVREVAVQGVHALKQVCVALAELDSNPEVEVIVIARGGGSLEDLLPFSEEALVRAVYAAKTPVVSAIGHEADSPLLDYVADLRASTPTDAGKRIVPDVEEEKLVISQAQTSLKRSLIQLLDREKQGLTQLLSRPALAAPDSTLLQREEDLDRLQERSKIAVQSQLRNSGQEIKQLKARVRALSPQQTLERGYSLVQTSDGQLVGEAASLSSGQNLTLRFAQGSAQAEVKTVTPAPARD